MANTGLFRLFGAAVIILFAAGGDLSAQMPAPKAPSKRSTVTEPRPWTDEEIENAFLVEKKCQEIKRSSNPANNPSNLPRRPVHRSHSPNIPKGAPNHYPKVPDYGEIPKDPETYWQWLCGQLWK